jgi:hypothetical protein
LINLFGGLEQVTSQENEILCEPFSKSEIKDALFSIEKNKAAGPDKIPIEFYQCCWNIIKGDCRYGTRRVL